MELSVADKKESHKNDWSVIEKTSDKIPKMYFKFII